MSFFVLYGFGKLLKFNLEYEILFILVLERLDLELVWNPKKYLFGKSLEIFQKTLQKNKKVSCILSLFVKEEEFW